MSRQLTAYEASFLLRYGIDPYSEQVQLSGSQPVEYLVGKAEFVGLVLNVNESVLIPRIETEGLVKLAVSHIESNVSPDQKVMYMDVGTGSGVVAIAVTRQLRQQGFQCATIATDISAEALEVAQRNAAAHNLSDSIKCMQSDLLMNIPQNEFSLVTANLPYIPSGRMDSLSASVRDYEPALALDGGEDGLSYIRRLLVQAADYVSAESLVCLEVDDTHDQSVADACAAEVNAVVHNLRWSITAHTDENEKNRFWVCKSA